LTFPSKCGIIKTLKKQYAFWEDTAWKIRILPSGWWKAGMKTGGSKPGERTSKSNTGRRI
jgi:hypothetical protein